MVAVERADIRLMAGQTTAVVGESGSGKTSLAMVAARLAMPSEGVVTLKGEVLGARLTLDQRADIQVIFQDAKSALDPRQTVQAGLAELRRIHEPRTDWIADEDLLSLVGLTAELLARRPHQLSGGQAQRVYIARALLLRPAVLIADEPTSALDMTVRRKIVDLLAELQARYSIAILLVTHDLAIVPTIAQQVHVMLRGSFVESGSPGDIFANPGHPYTNRLLAAAHGRLTSTESQKA
ncbi:ATP-binding cassette domain-containing protein [Amycolatopsis sp. GM8]|uniref:ATP-binding cassette domain-containing protein n=1 Tax=Amycolatopsis sp. GM8 TaxID=2896530 RepID=UPI001F00197E|nr:ATP-binding cassette domain-containing protein [Amycolatopsis sp. GM8]